MIYNYSTKMPMESKTLFYIFSVTFEFSSVSQGNKVLYKMKRFLLYPTLISAINSPVIKF